MKKKALIIGLVLILCVGTIGGYVMLDTVFPKAEPISYPSLDEIESVLIGKKNEDYITISGEKIEELLQKISQVKPTRIMSLNDYPVAETYYKVEVSAMRVYYYFIYEENSQVYVELPYEGVYKSDKNLLDLVSGIY